MMRLIVATARGETALDRRRNDQQPADAEMRIGPEQKAEPCRRGDEDDSLGAQHARELIGERS